MVLGRLLGEKLSELVVVLFLVSLGTFGLLSLVGGDPSVTLVGQGHPPEDYARARTELGLDDPFLTRYWHWLSGALHGDFGNSLVPPQSGVPSVLVTLCR